MWTYVFVSLEYLSKTRKGRLQDNIVLSFLRSECFPKQLLDSNQEYIKDSFIHIPPIPAITNLVIELSW